MAEIMVGVAPVDAELTIDANGTKSVIRLEAPLYRIGRDPANQLSYPAVVGLSREHLVVEREKTGWVARDVGSTNGTLVNGERISTPRRPVPTRATQQLEISAMLAHKLPRTS